MVVETKASKKYQIIYADPPWKYEFPHTRSKAMDNYSVMEIEAIKSLGVKDISETNSALFLWITNPNLPWAFDVMNSWGFKYKTVAFTWIKTNSNSMGLFWGMGQYTRSNPEMCLLGTRGKGIPVKAHDVHSVVMSGIMDHSHKPSIIREKIVQLMGDMPRIELFARRKVEGWDCWGNEVESDIEL